MGSHPSLTPAQDAFASVVETAHGRFETAIANPEIGHQARMLRDVQIANASALAAAIEAGATPQQLAECAIGTIGCLIAQFTGALVCEATDEERQKFAIMLMMQGGQHGLRTLARAEADPSMKTGVTVTRTEAGHA
jgi:hypothetical protein